MIKKLLVKLYSSYSRLTSLPVYLLFWMWRVDYGKNLVILGIPTIEKNRKAILKIGNSVKLTSKKRANLVGLTNKCILVCRGEKAEIVIGDNSGLSGVVIFARMSVKIGRQVYIGGNVRIFDNDFHQIHYNDRNDNTGEIGIKPVIIEDNVFIGTNSIILKGTHIMHGSVIGAGSVVSGHIPPNQVWAGNPAKYVRDL